MIGYGFPSTEAEPEVIIASAAITNIGASSSENVLITGTNTITGFGTASAGVVRYFRFSAALTLTHNATSLILPGSANITTAANDNAKAMSLGSGNWICTSFQRRAGGPITGTVSQSSLKSTTGEVSTAAGTPANLTLAGGEYGFYPQIKADTLPEAGSASIATSISVPTSYVTNIYLTHATRIMYAQQRYIQASPPYDLGDGDIKLFIFALVDNNTGKVLATYSAPEAPWHYNGPTDIRAERYTQDRRGYRTMNEFIAEHGSIKNAVSKGMTLDQAAVAFRNARMVDTEITQSIKNADMGLIPHPFLGNNLTGKTVVLIDPVGRFCENLSVLHDGGQSICELLNEGHIVIGNTDLPRRKPNSVMACSGRWKLT